MSALSIKKKPETVTESVLIADLKAVADCTNIVTRDFYREHGQFSDRQVSTKFATFEEFCKAAGVNQPAETSEIEGDKWSVFLPSTEFCSAAEVMKYCKVDTSVWELERFRAKDVSKDDGPRFQISAFFKKRKDILAIQSEIEDLKKAAKATIRRPVQIIPKRNTSGLMLEVAISDHHFGKLSWPNETNGAPYDLNIAEAMFNRALDTLIARSSGYKYEQIILVAGNDYLHANDIQGRTAGGTQLDTDCRFQKTYRTARRTLCSAIDRLKQIAPVKVIACYGNHDRLSMWTLADSVECYFHKDSQVTVDNQPAYRKYHQWGKCGLLFTHGDLGKRPDFPLLFATERPEIFGTTAYREVHTGHNHTTKTEEFHGVRVRILPSLTPADAWHAENGYVKNLRSAEAFVWSKDEGLIAQFIYTDDAYPILATERKLV